MSLGPFDIEIEQDEASVVLSSTDTPSIDVFVEQSEVAEVEVPGIQGPRGFKGDQGERGEKGDPGDAAFVHVQGVAASTWFIQHNIGAYPNVTVLDSAGTRVEGDIEYLNTTSLNLIFTSAFAGVAYLS